MNLLVVQITLWFRNFLLGVLSDTSNLPYLLLVSLLPIFLTLTMGFEQVLGVVKEIIPVEHLCLFVVHMYSV